MMQLLKITFDMLTPVAFPLKKQPYPIHLDALVIGIMTASNKKMFEPSKNHLYAPGQNPDVPLAVCGDKSPVYCASVAMIPKDSQTDIFSICKKPHNLRSEKESRPWLETTSTILPIQIIFECQGDKSELESILAKVRRIGPFRRVGLGEVANIYIEESDNPMAGLTYNGSPARMLPVIDWPQQNNWRKIMAATKAPYWYPGNREFCWSPPIETTIPNMSVIDYW
jgi:hypothetical protein